MWQPCIIYIYIYMYISKKQLREHASELHVPRLAVTRYDEVLTSRVAGLASSSFEVLGSVLRFNPKP